jgi:hypothetical protein
MKALLLLLALLQAAPPAAKFGWVKRDERGIVFKTGDSPMIIGLPYPRGTNVKFEVTSDMAVTFAVGENTSPGAVDPKTLTCLSQHVFKIALPCKIPADKSAFVIRDERKAGTIAAGVIARGDAFAKISAENKVMIVLYRWGCIENRPTEKAAAK